MTHPTRRPARNHPPVWLSLGLSMVVAGAVYPVTAFALDSTTPIMIATLRALLGGLVLTLVLPLFGSRLPRTRAHWRWALLIGLGNTTITQVAISVATDRAGAAVASVLLNSSPFMVAIASRALFAERITRLRAIGLVIGFAGVLAIVVADPGDVSERREPRGRPRACAARGGGLGGEWARHARADPP